MLFRLVPSEGQKKGDVGEKKAELFPFQRATFVHCWSFHLEEDSEKLRGLSYGQRDSLWWDVARQNHYGSLDGEDFLVGRNAWMRSC